MFYPCIYNSAGLDIEATGQRIARFIDESSFKDKELSKIMNLSVQSINKWRHGLCLPDIENMYILSRIIGVKVDDFLVPVSIEEHMPIPETEIKPRITDAYRLMECYKRLGAVV